MQRTIPWSQKYKGITSPRCPCVTTRNNTGTLAAGGLLPPHCPSAPHFPSRTSACTGLRVRGAPRLPLSHFRFSGPVPVGERALICPHCSCASPNRSWPLLWAAMGSISQMLSGVHLGDAAIAELERRLGVTPSEEAVRLSCGPSWARLKNPSYRSLVIRADLFPKNSFRRHLRNRLYSPLAYSFRLRR